MLFGCVVKKCYTLMEAMLVFVGGKKRVFKNPGKNRPFNFFFLLVEK